MSKVPLGEAAHETPQTTREHSTKLLLDSIKNQLPRAFAKNLEKDIEESEVATAIKKLGNGKAPGNDGLSIDYYKAFTSELTPRLHN